MIEISKWWGFLSCTSEWIIVFPYHCLLPPPPFAFEIHTIHSIVLVYWMSSAVDDGVLFIFLNSLTTLRFSPPHSNININININICVIRVSVDALQFVFSIVQWSNPCQFPLYCCISTKINQTQRVSDVSTKFCLHSSHYAGLSCISASEHSN